MRFLCGQKAKEKIQNFALLIYKKTYTFRNDWYSWNRKIIADLWACLNAYLDAIWGKLKLTPILCMDLAPSNLRLS